MKIRIGQRRFNESCGTVAKAFWRGIVVAIETPRRVMTKNFDKSDPVRLFY